jgi:hypothetical protein
MTDTQPLPKGGSERNRRRAPRLLAAGGVATLALVAPFGTAAYADSAAKSGPLVSHSAAHDQYGQHVVLKPAKSPPPSSRTLAQSTSKQPAVAASSPASTLPFTGFGLLKVVLIGTALLAVGFALRLLPARIKSDG